MKEIEELANLMMIDESRLTMAIRARNASRLMLSSSIWHVLKWKYIHKIDSQRKPTDF